MLDKNLSEWITQATSGDVLATMHLVSAHRSRLIKRIERRLRLNPFADFSAEDIMQEISTDVFIAIQSAAFDTDASFIAWLNRVADNRLAKTIRDRSRIKRGGKSWQVSADDSSFLQLFNDIHDEKVETGSERFRRKENKEAIGMCVAALSSEQQTAIDLSYFQQQSLDQIAETMGTTRDAVRGLIYRAKRELRQMMGESSRWLG
jgi:RNA polymerase sigma-70 factor (ECF subfamily)